MKTLKDFLEKGKKTSNHLLSLPSPNVIAGIISNGIIGLQLSKADDAKFSNKVSELAVSSEVIDELSAKVGSPKPHESEDEFVERAKLELKNILKSKLEK